MFQKYFEGFLKSVFISFFITKKCRDKIWDCYSLQ